MAALSASQLSQLHATADRDFKNVEAGENKPFFIYSKKAKTTKWFQFKDRRPSRCVACIKSRASKRGGLGECWSVYDSPKCKLCLNGSKCIEPSEILSLTVSEVERQSLILPEEAAQELWNEVSRQSRHEETCDRNKSPVSYLPEIRIFWESKESVPETWHTILKRGMPDCKISIRPSDPSPTSAQVQDRETEESEGESDNSVEVLEAKEPEESNPAAGLSEDRSSHSDPLMPDKIRLVTNLIWDLEKCRDPLDRADMRIVIAYHLRDRNLVSAFEEVCAGLEGKIKAHPPALTESDGQDLGGSAPDEDDEEDFDLTDRTLNPNLWYLEDLQHIRECLPARSLKRAGPKQVAGPPAKRVRPTQVEEPSAKAVSFDLTNEGPEVDLTRPEDSVSSETTGGGDLEGFVVHNAETDEEARDEAKGQRLHASLREKGKRKEAAESNSRRKFWRQAFQNLPESEKAKARPSYSRPTEIEQSAAPDQPSFATESSGPPRGFSEWISMGFDLWSVRSEEISRLKTERDALRNLCEKLEEENSMLRNRLRLTSMKE